MDLKKILQESISETYQDVITENEDVTYDRGNNEDNNDDDAPEIDIAAIGDPGIPSAISAGLGALTLRNAIRRRQNQ